MDSVQHFEDAEPAIILFANGSAVEAANEGVCKLARTIQEARAYVHVMALFLGPDRPGLRPAVAKVAEPGFQDVVAIPYFLTLGIHLHREFSRLVATAKEKHPFLEIQVSRLLEGHPKILSGYKILRKRPR